MRDHIDFIQAQHLPWQEADSFALPGASLKLLSSDDEDHSFSCVLRLPAGWSRAAGMETTDEEIYVLDGTIEAGGERLDEHCYAFLPAGSAVNGLVSKEGATLLYFRSGEVAAERRTPEAAESRRVARIDVSSGEWDGDFDKLGLTSMKNGARMRILREDPFSGETTYITATIAFRRGVQAERHPIVQEFFLLGGELAGELGVMQAGAYCFRPPMAKHAPYGTTQGALIFFRGLGGPQETFWEDTDPFSFKPKHQPILPDRLKHLGKPFPPRQRY